MAEYRHGHGLLRGCFKEDGRERLALNERASGIDIRLSLKYKELPQFLWADIHFLEWCRRPPQVSASDRAFHEAQRLQLVHGWVDELRMRPHKASDVRLEDERVDVSRFHWLAGVTEIGEICGPEVLSALPVRVLLEGQSTGIRIFFPCIDDPGEVFVAASETVFRPEAAFRR